jgi:hypothetical protein
LDLALSARYRLHQPDDVVRLLLHDQERVVEVELQILDPAR